MIGIIVVCWASQDGPCCPPSPPPDSVQKLMVFSTPKHPEFRVWSISLFNCQTRSASLRFAFCRSCGVQPFFSFFFFLIFVYLSAVQVLVAAHGIFRCGTWAQWLGHIGSRVVARRLQSWRVQWLRHGLWLEACGLFPDQGSNMCSLHRKAGS